MFLVTPCLFIALSFEQTAQLWRSLHDLALLHLSGFPEGSKVGLDQLWKNVQRERADSALPPEGALQHRTFNQGSLSSRYGSCESIEDAFLGSHQKLIKYVNKLILIERLLFIPK